VVIVPQEITSHANFLRLVLSRLKAFVQKAEKSSKRLNPYAGTVEALLCPRCNLTDDWCWIADLRRVIT
jgi:hypothetical protein